MKIKLAVALAVTVLAARVPTLAADAPAEPVVVLAASYSFGGDYADVTARVQTLVRNGELFHANPDSLLVDPHPGWNKCLVVFCEIHGKKAIFSTGENEEVSRDLLLEKSRLVAGGAGKIVTQVPASVPAAPASNDHWDSGGHAWTFGNPGGDTGIQRIEKALTLTVPGSLHNMFLGDGSPTNAPGCLTPVEGDFEAQVKVSGDFDPGAEPTKGYSKATHSAGILVWQDKDHYVRFERGEIVTPGSGGEHLYAHPLVQQNMDGKYEEYLGPMASYAPVLTEPATDLRLVRRGERMHAYVSRDGGSNWKEISDFESLKGSKAQVGISAVNTSVREFKATFDGLTVGPAKN